MFCRRLSGHAQLSKKTRELYFCCDATLRCRRLMVPEKVKTVCSPP